MYAFASTFHTKAIIKYWYCKGVLKKYFIVLQGVC